MDNIVRIYYFDGSIAGLENDSNVKSDPNNPFTLGLVIDQFDYYQIGNFTYTNENNELEVYKRRIQKSELPNAKVKAFYKIRMQNHQRKMIEEAVLIHFKDSFVALSLESREIKSEIQKAVSKANVIPLRDRSAIFFWEDKGDKIEMLKLPYDPTSAKALQKVYEADDEIKYAKATTIEDEEYLCVVDEPKYIKILKIDDNRVTIHKDYFVDTYFATSTDNQYLKQYSYCNEMVYSSSGGYMLQEKGKEKEFKFATMYFSQYSFDYNTTKFPMCTEEFILFALSPEWNYSYTQQKQYLLLAPPINSYQIKQRAIKGINFHEFFLHFDDKYIVYSKYDPNVNPLNLTHGSLKLSLYQLNGEVLQTVKIPTNTKTFRPTFSQNGEYMVVPFKKLNNQIDTKDVMSKMRNPHAISNGIIESGFKIYKIKRTESYIRINSGPQDVLDQNQNPGDNKDIFDIEIVKQIDLPSEYFEEQGKRTGSPLDDLEDGDDEIIFLHVDNKGNLIFCLPEKQIFTINGISHWNSFNDYVLKRCKTISDLEIVKFGQGTMVVKILESILYMKYTENKLIKGKDIKHKALDIHGECDLDQIILPKVPKFIIIVYELREVPTIIVWDTEKDIEHTNFVARKGDYFTDYVTGKNSKLGFACFNKYIVDLDIGVPNPYLFKSRSDNSFYWGQGMKINSNEDVLLSAGTIVTPICHKDIYFFKNKSLQMLDTQKVSYYMDKRSVAFDYIEDYEGLKAVLDIFDHDPLYYVMLILEDNTGKSPLQLAIENNSPRIIELMLNSLLKLGHFSLSRKIFPHFSTLFKMNLRSFEKYLNSCYFITEQMRSINKLDLPESQGTIRDHFPCSILDKEFYIKYEVPDKDGNIAGKEKKIKPNAVAPVDKSGKEQKEGEEEGALDAINVFDEEETLLKRVSVKGIEFDWIFQGDQANQFLKDLSTTNNIHIFGQDIIRDIILFEWVYFKRVIFWKLFIPYMIYFVMFCVYTTWLLERQYNEEEVTGGYHIASYVIGCIILVFNCFWAYIE